MVFGRFQITPKFIETRKSLVRYCLWLGIIPAIGLAQTQNIGANPLAINSQPNISSAFGARNSPFTGEHQQHDGLDIPSPTGSPILATGDGKVIFSGYASGYGNLIEIDHGHGYATRYGHAQILLVKTGDLVKQSQNIAAVGSTGRSTGPHLHFEVSFQGVPFDPMLLLGKQFSNQDQTNQEILVFTSKRLQAPWQLKQYAAAQAKPKILYTSKATRPSGEPYVIVRSHNQNPLN